MKISLYEIPPGQGLSEARRARSFFEFSAAQRSLMGAVAFIVAGG
jgi:hypothetical protein